MSGIAVAVGLPRRIGPQPPASFPHPSPPKLAPTEIRGNSTADVRNVSYNNYEYGICMDDPTAVANIRRDVLDYAALGALVCRQRLLDYCEIARRSADHLKSSYPEFQKRRAGSISESL